MKEIVVISGKGGTGKTSLTASFAYIAGWNVILADCDVDAADMHLLTAPEILREEDFYSSQEAVIDPELCTGCNVCYDVCHFDAILPGDTYKVIPLNCEGCAYCEKVCPEQAIKMKARLDGKWYISKTRFGSYMSHAKLGIGTENSGKLVSVVKSVAKQLAEKAGLEHILIDGPPGIGCPVISTLSGATFAVMITEPTVSGVHDLKRVYEIAKRFRVKTGVIVNKADLNRENYMKIMDFIKEENLLHICDIPYDETFVKALTQGKTIMEEGSDKLKKTLIEAWKQIISTVEQISTLEH